MRSIQAMAVCALIALQCGAQEQSTVAPRSVTPPRAEYRANTQNLGDTLYALDLYGKLTGRTILQGSLPRLRDQVVLPATEDTNAIIAYLESILATNGIAIVPLRTNFACAILSGMNDPRFLAELKAVTVPDITNSVGPGEIAFPNIDVQTFLDIYSAIAKQTIIRSALPALTVHLLVQNSMSMGEALYAMKVVMLLNGVAVIDDGDKFVQVVPVQVASQVRAHAPRPESRAKLIVVDGIPVFKPAGVGGLPRIPKPVVQPTVGERIGEIATNVRNAMLGPPAPAPPPPPPTVQSLAEFYAKLAGKELQATPQSGSRNIIFEVKTPLTKAEVLYVVEATLALEGLAIIPVDDKTVRVGKLSELAGDAGSTSSPAK